MLASLIGTIRPTNFGRLFNVRSVRKAKDLAYTSQALSAHTDNPYRKPIPGIQLLHCIKNDSEGGHSTLTDGFAVSEYLRKKTCLGSLKTGYIILIRLRRNIYISSYFYKYIQKNLFHIK